jgi:arsenate reductase
MFWTSFSSTMMKPSILFVCTGNSARSQMAEALLRHRAGDRVEVQSAGTAPKGVNPLTVRVMNEIGIDMEGHTSKSVQDVLRKSNPTHVFFVCAEAEESCPRIWPFSLHKEAWPFDDPAAATGSEEEQLEVFRAVRDQIDERVCEWVKQQLVSERSEV